MAKKKKEQLEESDNTVAGAIDLIGKRYGKGSVMIGADNFPDIERIHSGSLGLDYALNGGWPRGRMVELYGPPSSGKTNVALHAIREEQRAGGTCAFIDLEHALDAAYATSIGVDMDTLLVAQPDSGEQALDIIEVLTRTGEVKLIAVDSVANLVPEAELAGDYGQAHMGLQARLMSQGMRKLTALVSNNNVCLMFLNQTRSSLSPYGSPITVTGGNALKFYASQRIQTKVAAKILDKDEITAVTIEAKVIKNKVGFPFRSAMFDIRSDCTGIDKFKEILTLGVKYEFIEKGGSWYSYEGERLGQGERNVSDKLRSEPELAEKIEEQVRKAMNQ